MEEINTRGVFDVIPKTEMGWNESVKYKGHLQEYSELAAKAYLND